MKIKLKFIAMSLLFVFGFAAFLPAYVNADGASAGVYTRYYAGNYKIVALNVHEGYAGPRAGYREHTNILLYRWNGYSYKEIRNYHASAWTSYAGSSCWSIWESKKNSEWGQCNGGLDRSESQKELQNKLLDKMNQATFWEIAGTVAVVTGIVIVDRAFWPATVVALAAI